MKRSVLTLALATLPIAGLSIAGLPVAGVASAQTNIATAPATHSEQARRDIERAGYRDVRGLARDSRGVWHARALSGHTEVQLLVDADGKVSINR